MAGRRAGAPAGRRSFQLSRERQSRVALLVDPGGPQAAAVIGTLPGHAYVPLDQPVPRPWLAAPYAGHGRGDPRRGGAPRAAGAAAGRRGGRIELDVLAEGPDRALPPLPRVAPDDLAYIRHPGSTGRPRA
jgi:hypothetical protein